MATAALFTNPSILGRGDNADLPQNVCSLLEVLKVG